MREMLHYGFSSGPLNVIDADDWSKSKTMTHSTRTTTNTNSLTIIDKTHLNRALLETERKILGSTEDLYFKEGCKDCDMSLSD